MPKEEINILPKICQGCDNRVRPEDKGLIDPNNPCKDGKTPKDDGSCGFWPYGATKPISMPGSLAGAGAVSLESQKEG